MPHRETGEYLENAQLLYLPDILHMERGWKHLLLWALQTQVGFNEQRRVLRNVRFVLRDLDMFLSMVSHVL